MQGTGKAVGKAVSNSPCSFSSDVVFRQQKPGKDPPVWDAGRLWVPDAPGARAGDAPASPVPELLCPRCTNTGAGPPKHSLKPTTGVVKQEL